MNAQIEVDRAIQTLMFAAPGMIGENSTPLSSHRDCHSRVVCFFSQVRPPLIDRQREIWILTMRL